MFITIKAHELTDGIQDMNSAIRVMNMALQDKVKELQGGNAADYAKGLQELQVCELTYSRRRFRAD